MKHISGQFPSRAAALLLPCILLASCATTPREIRNTPLAEAAALQKSAGSPVTDPQRFIVSQLRAAEIASPEVSRSRYASDICKTSTAAVAGWIVSNRMEGTKRFSYQGTTYDLSMPAGRDAFPPSAFESLKPASAVPHTLLKTWHTRPGVGAPLAAKWKLPTDPEKAKFVAPSGYIMPVTAWLDFSHKKKTGEPEKARLEFLDPTEAETVGSHGKTQPLAADFSAPIVARTRDIRELLIALEGLIHPDVRNASLRILQPCDPSKTPVVFVHGLLSHPRMWRDVINDLMANPEIAAKYQFWVYYYPTGWPIGYSAMRLREDLAAADKAFGKQKHIVLVGHSMGGLLARMQAISPGKAIMHALVPEDRWEQFEKLPATHLGRRSMEFQANPAVERIVFICTPHRGSRVADWSLSTWFTKFIRLPGTVTSAAVDLLPSLVKSPWQYSSISRLSPSNPLYKVLEPIPIKAPHHSIIGDRGRGDTPDSSDGVVPYWSSHLASAESEVIVPDDHGAFDDPAAIAELARILKENLKSRH